MSETVLTALTKGTAELIASLPEQEKLVAWRTFLRYLTIYRDCKS